MPTVPRFLRSPWTWGVTALVLAAYAAAGFLWVPRLVANGLRDYVGSQYHRTLELGAVRFNPFTLELTLERLAIPDADGSPLLGFERLYVNLSVRSLVRLGADVQAIALDAPYLNLLRRPNGAFNVLDLVPPAPAPASEKPAAPPKVWIGELAIRGGKTRFVDRSGHSTLDLTLQPITFTLRDFSTRSEGNAYRLSARSTDGETLEWAGTFGLAPVLESQGSFQIGHLLAATIAEAAGPALPVTLAAGSFDIRGAYEFAERDHGVDLNVKVAELAASGLELRAPGESESWVVLPKVAVSGTAINLARASVVVEHVLVEHPAVHAWRERSGAVNLERLVRSPSAPAAATPAATLAATPAVKPVATAPPAGGASTPAWQVSVPDVKVTGGDVRFEDRSPHRPATFHLAALDVGVGGFAWPAAGPLAVSAAVTINDDGHASVKGTLTPAPLTGRLDLEATGLGLVALQPYLEGATAMTIKSGAASAKGSLTIAAGGKAEFQGDAAVETLRTVDNALEEDFIKWQSVRALGMRVQAAPLAIRIREVQVGEPYARVIIGSNGQTNLAQVLKPHEPPPVVAPADSPSGGTAIVAEAPPPAAAAAAPPPKATALPLEIGLVRIRDGSMNFSDFSIKPNVSTGIQDLAGTIRGLSGKADSRAEVKLEGKVDRYAPATIEGTVNFLAAVAYTNIKMSFKNVELGVLSPYSGKFAGYQIDKGKLSVDLNYLVENRKLTADHRIVVNQLQLGERVDSPEATSLPVKLAIALLKDRNGVIELDLPVSGSLDDPKFRLGPIVWKVVVNLIEKAVTAPFALLGRLFGGGEEMSYIDFGAGSAALDATSHGKLGSLVKALDARPGLSVDVPLVAAPAADVAALGERKWRDDIAARAAKRLGKQASEPGAVERLLGSPKDYRALLEEAYAQAFGHRAQPPAPAVAKDAPPPDANAAAISWLEGELKPRDAAEPAEVDALAQARASAVQAALLDGTGIDPGRVFIIKAPPAATATGPVRMQLALH
ncbi:MAG: DUF748 domain-containing protein [Proteobacteria bacterium]|nr:DUF748 domain-containing protein [Pseudomonadota bacterium]